MLSAKESLIQAVNGLNEEEASQVLRFIQSLASVRAGSVEYLAQDPLFEVPEDPVSPENVTPIRGSGIPASRLLIEDRR